MIQHYFPDKDELFLIVVKFIRGQFQQLAVDAMMKEKNPIAIMEAYVRSTFTWLKDYNKHARVWTFFLYTCAIDETYRKMHLQLTEMGQARIAEILQAGIDANVFKTSIATPLLAKHIQKIITGGLFEVATESGLSSIGKVENETWDLCRSLLVEPAG